MKIDTIRLTYLSLFTNLAYAVYNLVLGFYAHSWWFITMSAYYIVLSVVRFGLIKMNKNQNGVTERFLKRFTGGLLMFLAVCLAGSTYIAFEDSVATAYHEIVMITMALYAFTKITLAIINLVKARKGDFPVIKAIRSVSFADALMSIFALQRSMLVSFEGMNAGDIKLFNALTGTGVYLLVFLLGINLIGGKFVNMAKSKIVEANEKIAKGVVEGYKKIEFGVVDGYKKIEKGVVGGYTKIEDKFVEKYLAHDGESIEEAKERLKNNQK